MELYCSHKAGLSSVNKETVDKIIRETSKNSNFYLHEQKRHAKLMQRVNQYKEKLESLCSEKLAVLKRELDLKLEHLCDTIYSKAQETFLHVDMDAFYAAVETLDHPEYRNLPMVI